MKPDQNDQASEKNSPSAGGRELDVFDPSPGRTGEWRVRLANTEDEATYVSVTPLYTREFLNLHGNKLTKVEEAEADKMEMDSQTVARVREQMEKSKIYGAITKALAEAFREIGPRNIWLAKSSLDPLNVKDGSNESPGFDPYLLGGRIDFTKATIFVIPETKKDAIRDKLMQGVSLGGVVGEKFAPSRPIGGPFIDIENRGFILKFPGPDGAEQSMVFLYGEVKKNTGEQEAGGGSKGEIEKETRN